MPHRRLHMLVASAALLSCGPEIATPPSGPDASGRPDARPGAPPTFDVHEWGLLDVTSGSARLLAGPPVLPIVEDDFAPRRKPVLYFHLAPNARPFNVDVTVTIPAGSFVEKFPPATLSDDGTSLAWNDLYIGGQGCGMKDLPGRGEAACQTPDGICEAAELASYAASDATCVRSPEGQFNHLFYRANGPPPALPFDVASDGANLVIGRTRAPDLIGSIVYVHDEAGTITLSVIDPPAIGETVKAPPPTSTDVAAARRAIDAAMMVAGLSSAEAAAFNRAWSTDLFGGDGTRDMPSRRLSVINAPRDFILFAMPPSLADGVSTLSFAPSARSVKRFLLVRLHV